jgi:hypothetical protein
MITVQVAQPKNLDPLYKIRYLNIPRQVFRYQLNIQIYVFIINESITHITLSFVMNSSNTLQYNDKFEEHCKM